MHFHRHGWGGWGRQNFEFAGRGGGGRGGPHGRFGRGFMGGPMGGAFKLGRMLADGDLRLIALALIESEPRHGYDIIKALEEKSSGFYSPSPGVVYPTLTFLEEAGYVTSAAEGTKKVYTITESGRSYLAENRETVDQILDQMERFGKKMFRAREWFDWAGGGRGPMPEGGPDRDMPPGVADLDRARRRLRTLIADALEGTEEEQRRMAEILNRAADEILGKGRA